MLPAPSDGVKGWYAYTKLYGSISIARRAFAGQSLDLLWLDTAPQPQAQARELAQAMGARYLPLPHADARQLHAALG